MFFWNRHIKTKLFFLTKISSLQWFRFRKKRVFRLEIRRNPKKWLFSDFSCYFEIVTFRQKIFVLIQISYLQRFWFKKKLDFWLKICRRPNKKTLSDFSCFLKSSHQDETFSSWSKYHNFNGWFKKKNVFFSKKIAIGQKNTFSDLSCFWNLHIRMKLFCFHKNVIFQTVLIKKNVFFG